MSFALPKIPYPPKKGQLQAWDGTKYEPTSKIQTALTFEVFFKLSDAIKPAHADQAAVATSGAGSLDGGDTVDKAVLLAKIQALETLVNRLRLDAMTTGTIKGSA